MRPNLLSMTPAALTRHLASWGEPAYRAEQIQRCLWKDGALAWAEMTTLPQQLRDRLHETFEIRRPAVLASQRAKDTTVKVLFDADGARFEAVVMPGPPNKGATACLSSQAGCRLGCVFCATATMGLVRNLTAGEILSSYRALLAEAPIERVVFMGMGEPLDNFDEVLLALKILTGKTGFEMGRQRITVSTVGLVPGIDRLAKEGPGVRLAISLSAGDDTTRRGIMPIARKYTLHETVAAGVRYAETTGARVTAEYCLLAGINDRDEDADTLARLLSETGIGVNLIVWNSDPSLPYRSSDRIDAFAARLSGRVARVTVRRSKGVEIAAACGQLALRGAA